MSLVTRISDLAARIATEVKLRGAPPGGTTGQLMSKTSSTDFVTGWVDPTGSLPAEGGEGDVLTVVAGAWATAASESGLLAGYLGEWNAGTAYAVGDVVSRRGRLWEARGSSTNQTPETPPILSAFIQQTYGGGGVLGGGATAADSGVALAFTPASSVPIGAITITPSEVNAGKLLRVGIATSIGSTPADVVMLGTATISLDSATATTGMLATSIALTGGVTYYLLIQALGDGGDAYRIMTSGSPSYYASYIGVSGVNRRESVGGGAWGATSSDFIPVFSLSSTTAAWTEIATIKRTTRLTVDGTAAPTTGDWLAGDIVLDTTPSAGGFIGWVCTVAGAPGTWEPYGSVDPLPGVPGVGSESDVLTVVSGVWAPAHPSSTVPVRRTTTLTGATGDGAIALAAGYVIRQVAYSGAGRLRIFKTATGRTADTARAFTTYYPGGRGLIYDYLAVAAETDLEHDAEGSWPTGEATAYYRVDGGPVDITITWQRTE